MKQRELQSQDKAGMLEWMSDPEIRRKFCFGDEKLKEKNIEKFIESAVTEPIEGKDIHFAIADECSNEYLGTISLKKVSMVNRNAEYDICLRKSVQGKGVAAEATQKLLEFAFEKFGLVRVYLNVFSDNFRAIKLYECCGFIYEGEFREHIHLEGKYKSLKWYSILKNKYYVNGGTLLRTLYNLYNWKGGLNYV